MRDLLTFFSLTYIVSWSLYAAATAVSDGAAPPSGLGAIRGLLILLGVFAPSLVALALTAARSGRAGVRALLLQVVRGPVKPRLYVFAIVYMAAIKLAAALLHRLISGVWPPFGQTPVYVMAGALLISTPVQAGEEIGWRGYALPRLSAGMGLARGGIVLGVLWACWHLPFFFMPGTDSFGQSFPVYLLQVTALSVAMAWLYWRAGGSLLPVMLLHAAVNNTKDIVPSAQPGATDPFALSTSLVAWLTVALLWIGASYFLTRMGPARLSPVERPPNAPEPATS